MPKCKMFHVKHSQTKHKINAANHQKCRSNAKQVSRNTGIAREKSRSTVAPGRSQIRIHAPNSQRPGMSCLRSTKTHYQSMRRRKSLRQRRHKKQSQNISFISKVSHETFSHRLQIFNKNKPTNKHTITIEFGK